MDQIYGSMPSALDALSCAFIKSSYWLRPRCKANELLKQKVASTIPLNKKQGATRWTYERGLVDRQSLHHCSDKNKAHQQKILLMRIDMHALYATSGSYPVTPQTKLPAPPPHPCIHICLAQAFLEVLCGDRICFKHTCELVIRKCPTRSEACKLSLGGL